MRRTGTFCDDCGAELEVLVHGGEEPDPDRPGKYRPATTAYLRCPEAARRFRAEEARLLQELRETHRAHLQMVRVPWPPPARPSSQDRLPLERIAP